LPAVPQPATQQQDEIAQLRARVAALERELADRTERANAAVAAAEDRTYWLDRWGLDLNAVMERPLAQRAYALRTAIMNARGVAGKIRRRLLR
jgi:hypothetical protein